MRFRVQSPGRFPETVSGGGFRGRSERLQRLLQPHAVRTFDQHEGVLYGGDFQQRDQVVARGAERDVGRLFRESVVGLGEFRTYEQQFRFGDTCLSDGTVCSI